jgi:UDP-N-acetylglucosamine diphosphorylase/glucosamine-1-phosphate N-acetyltransferase
MSVSAIILAAGKGTRMKSDLPKVLHEVCGRPMVEYVIDACRDAGARRVVMVVGHKADLVKATVNDDRGDLEWVLQEPQLGTGHAVMVDRDQLATMEGPVLVLAGDGPLLQAETLRELIETHRQKGASCTLATSILPDPGNYGRIVRDDNGDLQGIVEAKEATPEILEIDEVNVSLYCFDAADLLSVLDRIDNDNAKGEYYLTDALELLREDGKTLAAVAAVPPEDTVSINTVEELATVNEIMRTRRESAT